MNEEPSTSPSPAEEVLPVPVVPGGGFPEVRLAAELPASKHPAAVYLASVAPGSRKSIACRLRTVARILTASQCSDIQAMDWSALRFEHTALVRSVLMGRYAPTGANSILAALKGVIRTAWRLGQMTGEDYMRAVDVRRVRGSSIPRGRSLTQGELTALFVVCAADPTPAGARDAAALAVLYGGGLRKAELPALKLEDYNTETGELIVRKGKGNKDRNVYLTNGAMEAMADWLKVRGDGPGEIFCTITSGRWLTYKRASDHLAESIVSKRMKEARVKKFTPHDLRRTFISTLLTTSGDLSAVKELAGHAHVSTTLIYDKRGEAPKQQAAATLHVPYISRNS